MPKPLSLIIQAEDKNSYSAILAAGPYQLFWEKQKDNLIGTFYRLTGLEFQQGEIIAKVIDGAHGSSGHSEAPMILPGGTYTSQDEELTLVHELAHRLLGGNALNPTGLGLVPDGETEDPRYQNFEHRHMYLFLYDAVKEALGADYAERCAKFEGETTDGDYKEAWEWAMSMPFDARQRAIHILAQEALPRERWHERDNTEISPRDPDTWFKNLSTP